MARHLCYAHAAAARVREQAGAIVKLLVGPACCSAWWSNQRRSVQHPLLATQPGLHLFDNRMKPERMPMYAACVHAIVQGATATARAEYVPDYGTTARW
jgi:hypothetical protein